MDAATLAELAQRSDTYPRGERPLLDPVGLHHRLGMSQQFFDGRGIGGAVYSPAATPGRTT